MDGIRHPVGDQPATVYWKRRLAVVIAIVVLGLLVWWVISALTTSSDPGTTPNPGSTVTTSPTTSPTTDLSRACGAEDITVATGPADGKFTGDSLPTFTVTVTGIGDSPCIVDPTSGSKIVIKSGSDTWFDSSKCTGDYTTFDSEPFLIQPSETHDLTTTWNRGRDDAGCSPDPAKKVTGFYWATATVGGVTADKIQFQIA